MPPKNTINKDRVRELLRKGVASKAVAERLGINRTSVFTIAKELRKEAGNG